MNSMPLGMQRDFVFVRIPNGMRKLILLSFSTELESLRDFTFYVEAKSKSLTCHIICKAAHFYLLILKNNVFLQMVKIIEALVLKGGYNFVVNEKLTSIVVESLVLKGSYNKFFLYLCKF